MEKDISLKFHCSFNELLDTFRFIIASATWLKCSTVNAEQFFADYPHIIQLTCSIDNRVIKIDKTILRMVEQEGINGPAPLYSKALINFYRIFTVAIKDIVWEEPDFSNLKTHPYLQFLRHLRNASAHNNQFFWGSGRNRRVPSTVKWRNKEIKEELENEKLYMNFMKPGDLFIFLSDISKLVNNKDKD